MIEQKKSVDHAKKLISLKNLYLDPNNFRLIHETEQTEVDDSKLKDKTVINRTFHLLAGEKNKNIQDLIDSFKSNGYLPVDQIQVREIPDGGYVVVEGNRRIAALKYLSSEYDAKSIDLEKLDSSIFSKVPVVLYENGNEMHHLTLMALKHISGNKKWGEWNQAKLLEKMSKSFHLSENEICNRVSISKVELLRSLRALSFVEQYQTSDYGDQFNESKFPIFKEAIKSSALKGWLEWDDQERRFQHSNNLNLFFSWISREPKEEEDEDGQVSFGEKYLEPAIVKRDDVRILGQLVNDKKAIEELKISRNINNAYRVSDLVFKERQEGAVKSVINEIDTLGQMAIQSKNLPELEKSLGRLQTIIDKAKTSEFSGVEQNSVFHDRIDKHFTELEICRYRKIHNLKITKLSRINLFAGINNSGKTTFLEAIYLLSKQNDFGGLSETIRRRGKVSEDRLNLEWFSKQLPKSFELNGCFDNQKTSVSMRHFLEENNDIDKTRYLKSIELTSIFAKNHQESLTQIFQRDRKTQANSIKLLCPAVFSSPFFLNEPHRYASFYHKSTQSKALPYIFEFIKRDVVPSISDIRLVDEWQRFLVADSDYQYAPDLMEYGEGLQRIFFISLLFASAQNGIVLIDEFENAIHAELIGKFCHFIHTLSKIFNVQVFLTSHSKECIDAFIQNVPDVNDFAFHTLVCRDGNIVAREFTGHEFQKLLNAGNVDLRRAK
ncbi:MAG: AAA family ATPase [Methylococcales bacterium]|nr:AAA family ATPase [Methylococcales bacterium]